MGILEKLHKLEKNEKLLIAIAVLVDGEKSAPTLALDKEKGAKHSELAKELLEVQEEIRLPLLGSIVRQNI
jgi:hypothetical protein